MEVPELAGCGVVELPGEPVDRACPVAGHRELGGDRRRLIKAVVGFGLDQIGRRVSGRDRELVRRGAAGADAEHVLARREEQVGQLRRLARTGVGGCELFGRDHHAGLVELDAVHLDGHRLI